MKGRTAFQPRVYPIPAQYPCVPLGAAGRPFITTPVIFRVRRPRVPLRLESTWGLPEGAWVGNPVCLKCRFLRREVDLECIDEMARYVNPSDLGSLGRD